MKLLVTGGGGYIGSVLIPMALEMGYDVVCLDRFFFGIDVLKEYICGNLKLIKEDIRYFDPSIMKGIDAVFDLAALSNDPTGELDPDKTMDINYRGRVRVATIAKKYGVTCYVLASSCSVYGYGTETFSEVSALNPLTTYARANVLAEREILAMRSVRFVPVVLRQATVYGLSPRMRFDLAINGMVLGFYRDSKVPIMRDGTQWRPFIHVKDTSRAFITILEAEPETVNGEIFNVGSNEQNIRIFDLAAKISKAIGIEFRYEWYGSKDNRSYKVDFSKIKNVLGFETRYGIEEGALEVYNALRTGTIKDDIKAYTVRWYRYLLEIHKLIKDIEYRGEIL